MRKKATAARQPDTTNTGPSVEEAERKVLSVWKAFEQIFGRRWTESFGNNPTGIDDPRMSLSKESRMTQWIEALRYTPWPQVVVGIERARTVEKPYEGWLPDLPWLMRACGKPVSQEKKPEETRYWFDDICIIMLRWVIYFGPNPENDQWSADTAHVYNELRMSLNATKKDEEGLTVAWIAKSLVTRLSHLSHPHIENWEAAATILLESSEELWAQGRWHFGDVIRTATARGMKHTCPSHMLLQSRSRAASSSSYGAAASS